MGGAPERAGEWPGNVANTDTVHRTRQRVYTEMQDVSGFDLANVWTTDRLTYAHQGLLGNWARNMILETFVREDFASVETFMEPSRYEKKFEMFQLQMSSSEV